MAEYIVKVGEEGFTVMEEIVRCKDCKYWRRDTDHTCKEHSLVSPMLADGFCIRGVRKDGKSGEQDDKCRQV